MQHWQAMECRRSSGNIKALCGMPTRAAGAAKQACVRGWQALASCGCARPLACVTLGEVWTRCNTKGPDRQGGIRLRERLLAAGERPRPPLRLLQQALRTSKDRVTFGHVSLSSKAESHEFSTSAPAARYRPIRHLGYARRYHSESLTEKKAGCNSSPRGTQLQTCSPTRSWNSRESQGHSYMHSCRAKYRSLR